MAASTRRRNSPSPSSMTRNAEKIASRFLRGPASVAATTFHETSARRRIQPVARRTIAQRDPLVTVDKKAGYAGACHRAARFARTRWANPALRVARVLCRKLPLQRKSNAQGDLVMTNRPIFNMPSRLHDFEPFHVANGLCCAGQGILNGIFNTMANLRCHIRGSSPGLSPPAQSLDRS